MSEVAKAAPSRESIERLEAAMLEAPQVAIETSHVLSGGVYARTIRIPAGTLLTGLVHKHDHVNVCVGDITVWTEQGMKRLTGHNVLPTKAGAKRAGYAHADTYWTTLSRTDQTELAAIEDEQVENVDRLQTRQQALGGPGELRKLEN